MRALIWTGKSELHLEDVPVPEVGKHEVLIKVEKTGICGSDIHAYLNTHRFRKPPAVLGHEVVGYVEEVGRDVQEFSPGDYVTVIPQISCNQCELCLSGHQNLCRKKVVPGTNQWVGTFAEYFVAPAETVIKLPESMPSELGALIEPLAVGVHAVRRVPTVGGKNVVVLGAGPIGFLTAVSARDYGAASVTCIDIDDVALETAKQFDFTVIDPRQADIPMAEVVFLTSSYPQSVNDALRATRPAGTLVVVSMFEGELPVDIYHSVFNEIDVLGSMTYTKLDFIEAIKVADRAPSLADIASGPVALAEAKEAFDAIVQGHRKHLKVLLDPHQ